MTCPAAQECFGNPVCVSGVFCGLGACPGLEGSEALGCWIECFGGDAGLALTAINATLCLGENCADACSGFGQ
jgi:hypothetical protein